MATTSIVFLAGCQGETGRDVSGRGNTVGNIVNEGYAATDGTWIYFISNDLFSIYRMRPDGTEQEKLSSDIAKHINVLDGWVYYSNWMDGKSIYRMRTDGSGRERLP